jgi:hypothetical protein
MAVAGLFNMIERLCAVSTDYGETVVSQWDDIAIIVEPGDDPFNVYRQMQEPID